MHSFRGKSGTHVHFSSDRSGTVIVHSPLGPKEGVEVPCSDLVEFVAELVRRDQVARAELEGDEEILGLGFGPVVWEYHVMLVRVSSPRKMTELLNEMAEKGWVLFKVANDGGDEGDYQHVDRPRRFVPAHQHFIFRRPKRG